MFIPRSTNLDPKAYFCETSAHDLYPVQPYPYQYIEIQLYGYYVNPSEYVLKGRSYNSLNLPTNWDFLGFDGKKWVILNETRNDALYQNTLRSFNVYSKKYFSSFRLQMQGKTTSGDWHLAIESIEVYGKLTDNMLGMLKNVRCTSCSRAGIRMTEFLIICLLSY